jgi:hypothetical protein
MCLDILTQCCRAFYNAKGILVYDLGEIRTRYLSGWFFLDLIAALPLQALVAMNGQVNEQYSAWLRMPKLLRVYRLIQLYRASQNYRGRIAVTFGILQQLPLLFCLTHLYGCVHLISLSNEFQMYGICMRWGTGLRVSIGDPAEMQRK